VLPEGNHEDRCRAGGLAERTSLGFFMSKVQLHLISIDSRSAGLAWVSLAPATPDCENRTAVPKPGKPHGIHPLRSSLGRFHVQRMLCAAAWLCVTIPIAEAARRLRGLVQHVLTFRDKTLYVRLHECN
jgi:hypothetical protein